MAAARAPCQRFRMRQILLLAAALSWACAERPVRVSPAATKALGSPEEACRTTSLEVPDFPPGGLPGPPASAGFPRPVFRSRPLLPPQRPGQSMSEALGCLAGERTAIAGARHPAPRELLEGGDSVRVNPLEGGLLITHQFAHPCCLRATLSATVEGATVRVSEVLGGKPCGCLCASRLRTAIALAPGRYSVEIAVRGPAGEERTVAAGTEIMLESR